jgi:hypothetical protein
VRVWTGFIWLRVGSSDRFQWPRYWSSGFDKRRGISWPDEGLWFFKDSSFWSCLSAKESHIDQWKWICTHNTVPAWRVAMTQFVTTPGHVQWRKRVCRSNRKALQHPVFTRCVSFIFPASGAPFLRWYCSWSIVPGTIINSSNVLFLNNQLLVLVGYTN